MKKRPYGSDLAVIGYALVFLALGLLIAYCVRISPDQPPTPTPTPTAAPVATFTPGPTATAYVSVIVTPIRTSAPARTPDHPATAVPSQTPKDDQEPTPTAMLQPAPVQIPQRR
jgi:hypothetical protein